MENLFSTEFSFNTISSNSSCYVLLYYMKYRSAQNPSRFEQKNSDDKSNFCFKKSFNPLYILFSLLLRLACRDFLGVVYGFKSIIMAPAVMTDNITHLCSFNFEVLSHVGENVLACLRLQLLYKIELSNRIQSLIRYVNL